MSLGDLDNSEAKYVDHPVTYCDNLVGHIRNTVSKCWCLFVAVSCHHVVVSCITTPAVVTSPAVVRVMTQYYTQHQRHRTMAR